MSDPRLYPEWLAQRDDLRTRACRDNVYALQYLGMMMDAVEIWDDMVDKDKPVADADINGVFFSLMLGLPQNPFFDQNKAFLLPITLMCVNAWFDANLLEKSEDIRLRQSAWWLKQMGVELYGAVAYLCGGFEHMRKISQEARVLLMHEDFLTFEKEHNNA
jgi:hypothetical protein